MRFQRWVFGLLALDFRVSGLGLVVYGFRVYGFRVQGLGFRVEGFGGIGRLWGVGL